MRRWPIRRWAITIALVVLCALLPPTRHGTESSADAPRIKPCPGICGRVSNARTGEPVAHFKITIFSAERAPFPPAQFKMPAGFPVPPGPIIATHDIDAADGSFAIAAPNATAVFVGAWAPGYWPRESATLTPGADPITIELEPRGKVSVKLVDERGAPVVAAAVHHDNRAWPLALVLEYAASDPPIMKSDARGEILIDEPFPAGVNLLVLTESNLPQRVRIGQGERELVVKLRDGVILRGVTRSHDGKPVATVVEARCQSLEPIRVHSRADGTFVFKALPRGRCELLASRHLVDEGRSLDPIRGSVIVNLSPETPAVDITIPPPGTGEAPEPRREDADCRQGKRAD